MIINAVFIVWFFAVFYPVIRRLTGKKGDAVGLNQLFLNSFSPEIATEQRRDCTSARYIARAGAILVVDGFNGLSKEFSHQVPHDSTSGGFAANAYAWNIGIISLYTRRLLQKNQYAKSANTDHENSWIRRKG